MLQPIIERAREQLGLTYSEIADALNVDESTLHRWRIGASRLRKSAGERGTAGLSHLMDSLDGRWGGDRQTALAWLNTPHPACAGEAPRSWLTRGRADYLAGLLAEPGDSTAKSLSAAPQFAVESVFELAPVGMALIALSGEFASVNRHLCQRLGYEREALIGRRFQDVTHPDDLAGDLDLALKLLGGAIPSYTLLKRYMHRDGRMIWARLTGTIIRDDAGKPTHFLAVIDFLRDVEAAAVRQALGQAPGGEGAREGMWEWDVASGELVWSPQIARALGRPPQEITQTFQAFLELVHPDDLEGISVALNAYVSGSARHIATEFRIRHADGSWRWLHSQGRAVARDHEGRPVRIAGLHSDVTDRRLVQEHLEESQAALARSDARFRALVESEAHILWTTDASGSRAAPSATWLALTGVSEEVVEREGWSVSIHPDDRAASMAQWRNAVQTCTPFAAVHRVRRYDGEYRWMVVRGVPVRDATGQTVEWVGTHTDITDHRPSESMSSPFSLSPNPWNGESAATDE